MSSYDFYEYESIAEKRDRATTKRRSYQKSIQMPFLLL